MNNNMTETIISFVTDLVIAVVLALLIVKFIAQRTHVSGSSMEETLFDGQNLLIDKISPRFRGYRRFDIVVLDNHEKKYLIKRIVGLPGETVQIDDGRVWINEAPLEDDPMMDKTIKDPGIFADPVVLEGDEYFVLGDNRNNSRDSRSASVGAVKHAQIVGRVPFRLTPFSKFGRLE